MQRSSHVGTRQLINISLRLAALILLVASTALIVHIESSRPKLGIVSPAIDYALAALLSIGLLWKARRNPHTKFAFALGATVSGFAYVYLIASKYLKPTYDCANGLFGSHMQCSAENVNSHSGRLAIGAFLLAHACLVIAKMIRPSTEAAFQASTRTHG